MAIHILRFARDNQTFWGILENNEVLKLELVHPCTTTKELVSLGIEKIKNAKRDSTRFKLTDIQLLSPITSDAKIVCQGANYRQHMIDSGMNPNAKKFNMFFTKSSASIHDPVGIIQSPKHVQLLDYEIELCLILKKEINQTVQVAQHHLHEYVAGICIGNDISARDIQIPQTQFFKGKSYRTFCPLGPVLCLLEADEMHYLDELQLKLQVNHQIRQQDCTANMVFKPTETISELSEIINFNVGDIIMTGTPSGCALSLPSPLVVKMTSLLPEEQKWKLFIQSQKRNGRYLNHGDLLELTIQSLDQKIDLGRQIHHIEHL
jgi:2-keto-4-pentenoate hydratase/2-oxohepta-3-ene-1,7-dioic acid hydratase in catechol pathway